MTAWKALADMEQVFKGKPLREIALMVASRSLSEEQRVYAADILAAAYLELTERIAA